MAVAEPDEVGESVGEVSGRRFHGDGPSGGVGEHAPQFDGCCGEEVVGGAGGDGFACEPGDAGAGEEGVVGHGEVQPDGQVRHPRGRLGDIAPAGGVDTPGRIAVEDVCGEGVGHDLAAGAFVAGAPGGVGGWR